MREYGQSFTIKPTKINGCDLYSAKMIPDHRGFFSEIFSSDRYPFPVRQINCSHSHPNVFRGIHTGISFNKVVTCVKGSILDYCVDLREDSSTYKTIVMQRLSEENFNQLIIPAGCGHGFFAEKESVVVYGQCATYQPNGETTHCYKDLGIQLPVVNVILSEKDSCE